jgi:salicylate hydroxylase
LLKTGAVTGVSSRTKIATLCPARRGIILGMPIAAPTTPIAVIGGGLGGLVTALALQRAGLAVRVFEKAAAIHEIGAGITLAPNASRVIDQLGLADKLRAIGHVVQTQGVMNYTTGELLVKNARGDAPFKKYGAHYYQLHRADLQDMLVAAIRGNDADAIQVDATFIGLRQSDDQVIAEFADGSDYPCAALIGCDGLRSSVRRCLFATNSAVFTGRVAWRGLVPTADIGDWPMPVESATLIGPNRIFGFYPIRNYGLMNYVAISRREEWTEEGWSIRSSVEEVVAEFDGWYPPILTLVRATPQRSCFKWGLFDHPPLEQWTVNRATLLGDAAHPMLPYMGQGASMAIEDGAVLARSLAKYAPDVPQALQRYEALRKPRANLVQLESRRKGDRWEAPAGRQYTQGQRRNEESLGLFEYDAMAVEV